MTLRFGPLKQTMASVTRHLKTKRMNQQISIDSLISELQSRNWSDEELYQGLQSLAVGALRDQGKSPRKSQQLE